MRNNEDDISIGPEKWISWQEFDASSVDPIDIDELINPLMNFLKNMEIECVPECCGIHAFGFWEKDILNALKWSDQKDIRNEISASIEKLKVYSERVLVSSYLNQLIHQKTLLEVLIHIKTVLYNTQQRL